MRSLDVCKKCKWFQMTNEKDKTMTCNIELADDGFSFGSGYFDSFYYTEDKFVVRELHPKCIFKVEQMVILDGQGMQKKCGCGVIRQPRGT